MIYLEKRIGSAELLWNFYGTVILLILTEFFQQNSIITSHSSVLWGWEIGLIGINDCPSCFLRFCDSIFIWMEECLGSCITVFAPVCSQWRWSCPSKEKTTHSWVFGLFQAGLCSGIVKWFLIQKVSMRIRNCRCF